jgi:hypothetical protein
MARHPLQSDGIHPAIQLGDSGRHRRHVAVTTHVLELNRLSQQFNRFAIGLSLVQV